MKGTLNFKTMKTTTKTFSICITALVILFSINSCNDVDEVISPFPYEPNGENDIEVLLTDNLIKQWRLVNIYDHNNNKVPSHNWSECEKSEILTFNTNNSFSISCSENGISLFTWDIKEMEGVTLLDLESVSSSEVPPIWTNQKIVIHLLTDNAFILEIEGIKHEYIPFYLENSDPRDYQ